MTSSGDVKAARVFLDTNILKLAAEKLPRFTVPVFDSSGRPLLDEGGNPVLRKFYSVYVPRPKKGLPVTLEEEVKALKVIADEAKLGRLTLLMSLEVKVEFWGLPESFALDPLMYGAPIETADPPFRYSRSLSGPPGSGSEGWRTARSDFLQRITHARFKVLARTCAVDPDLLPEN